MKAEKLSVFISSVVAFFEQVGEKLTEVDTPYLNSNDMPLAYDYSGVITITGPLTGCVYVSAETPMLRDLLVAIGEPENSLALLKDLIGEVANTVSGNARTEFGSDFIISPPKIVDGAPSVNFLPKDKRTYVIPFHWHEYDGVIGICVGYAN